MSESKPVTAPGVDIEAIRKRWESAIPFIKTDITALIAEIERLQSQPSGWRPISEAPGDGTRVLLLHFASGHQHWMLVGSQQGPGNEWWSNGTHIHPTHWMPLPPPQEQP